jgi:hypothetical protein
MAELIAYKLEANGIDPSTTTIGANETGATRRE